MLAPPAGLCTPVIPEFQPPLLDAVSCFFAAAAPLLEADDEAFAPLLLADELALDDLLAPDELLELELDAELEPLLELELELLLEPDLLPEEPLVSDEITWLIRLIRLCSELDVLLWLLDALVVAVDEVGLVPALVLVLALAVPVEAVLAALGVAPADALLVAAGVTAEVPDVDTAALAPDALPAETEALLTAGVLEAVLVATELTAGVLVEALPVDTLALGEALTLVEAAALTLGVLFVALVAATDVLGVLEAAPEDCAALVLALETTAD